MSPRSRGSVPHVVAATCGSVLIMLSLTSCGGSDQVTRKKPTGPASTLAAEVARNLVTYEELTESGADETVEVCERLFGSAATVAEELHLRQLEAVPSAGSCTYRTGGDEVVTIEARLDEPHSGLRARGDNLWLSVTRTPTELRQEDASSHGLRWILDRANLIEHSAN